MIIAYCSYEKCRRLKELGFDIPVGDYFFIIDGMEEPTIWRSYEQNYNKNDFYFSCPTLAVAAQWLRDVKGFHISIDCTFEWDKWFVTIHDRNEEQWSKLGLHFPSHDLALGAGIDKILENINEKFDESTDKSV